MKMPAVGNIVLFLFAGICSLTPAQQLQAAKADPAHIIHLDVIVQNTSGRPVQGLRESSFTVLDNGVKRPISSFKDITEESPASVTIIVDAVNAPADAVSYQREQLIKFLRANGGHLALPTSIGILTDVTVRISSRPTVDGNAMADALSHADIGLREIRRDTGFYGAEERTETSLNALHEIIANQSRLPGRKLVVWISPGWPLLSGGEVVLSAQQQASLFTSVIKYSTQLREARITLYDVNTWGADESVDQALYYEGFTKGVRKPSQTDLGDLSLQVLALQSGGLVQNSNDLGNMLKKCEADAGAYYEVSIEAPAADKNVEYHNLAIRIDRPGLKARTRQGYYVTP